MIYRVVGMGSAKLSVICIFREQSVREMGNIVVVGCGLGYRGGRHAIPRVSWAGPGVQSPVAVRYGAVLLGGAY